MHWYTVPILLIALIIVLVQIGSDLTAIVLGLPAKPVPAHWALSLSAWTLTASGLFTATLGMSQLAWWSVPLALLSTTLVAPWPLARWVAIPLGMHRVTYWLARASPLMWATDPTGGAMFAAAWAVMRGGDRDAARWVEARAPASVPLTPAVLGSLGLLAAARGDHREAEGFLEATTWFDLRTTPKALRRFVSSYRMARAAQRGRWAQVESIAASGPTTYDAKLLAAVAGRLLDRDDAADEPTMRWLYWTRPTLWAAASPWVGRRHEPVAPEVPTWTGGPLSTALRTQVWLLSLDNPDLAAVVATARAWDAALDPELEGRLRDRGIAVGARTPGGRAATLREQVRADLAEVVGTHALTLPPLTDSVVLAEVAASVRETHLATIELAAAHIEARVSAGERLPVVDEVREWLALRTLYDEGVAASGESLRRLVFRPVYTPLCALSVSLYNDREQRWLSNAITRWLLDQAERVGDARAVDLQRRNLEAGG